LPRSLHAALATLDRHQQSRRPRCIEFSKARVETIELPDGRRIPDYYQLEMPSFAFIFAETADGRIIVYR
jgi:hypothetical protein